MPSCIKSQELDACAIGACWCWLWSSAGDASCADACAATVAFSTSATDTICKLRSTSRTCIVHAHTSECVRSPARQIAAAVSRQCGPGGALEPERDGKRGDAR